MSNKIYKLLKNPIFVFTVITLLITIFLGIKTGFSVPNYYIDKELAEQLAQTVSKNLVDEKIKHLINPQYKTNNFLFQIWGWSLVFFIFTTIFRVKNFNTFKNLNFFKNKIFIYLWINFSYILFITLFLIIFMNDIMEGVYHWTSDSLSIPLFTMGFILLYSTLVYYPLINVLSYITYNTKIKRKLYQLFWGLGFIINLCLIIFSMFIKFTYLSLFLYLYYLIWLILIIYSINHIKNKIP